MKQKNTIRNISMFAFVLVMIFMKVGSLSAQMTLGVLLCLGCLSGGIYFIYKGLKSVGVVILLVALAVFFCVLGSFFDSYNLFVPVPSCIFLACFLGTKIIVIGGDREQIRGMKSRNIIGSILYVIIQTVMIILLFIKH